MTTIRAISKSLLTLLMVGAGAMHFINSGFFLKIVPPYLPLHLEVVYLSGVCEIALGILLLIPKFTRFAAWGIIALLIAVFPANIYLYQHQEIVPATPTVHFLRLLLDQYGITRIVNRIWTGDSSSPSSKRNPHHCHRRWEEYPSTPSKGPIEFFRDAHP